MTIINGCNRGCNRFSNIISVFYLSPSGLYARLISSLMFSWPFSLVLIRTHYSRSTVSNMTRDMAGLELSLTLSTIFGQTLTRGLMHVSTKITWPPLQELNCINVSSIIKFRMDLIHCTVSSHITEKGHGRNGYTEVGTSLHGLTCDVLGTRVRFPLTG